jgi:hypothetical protein
MYSWNDGTFNLAEIYYFITASSTRIARFWDPQGTIRAPRPIFGALSDALLEKRETGYSGLSDGRTNFAIEKTHPNQKQFYGEYITK